MTRHELYIINESLDQTAIRVSLPDHVKTKLEALGRLEGISWKGMAIKILCEQLEAKIL